MFRLVSHKYASVLRNIASAPWWFAVFLGLAAAGLGIYLFSRPLTSLSTLGIVIGLAFIVSGIGELLRDEKEAAGRPVRAVASAEIIFGVMVIVWLGRSIDLLPFAVALALIGGGALRLTRAIRGNVDERLAAGLHGLTDIIFGFLAWQWPDVTLVIVAIVFGIRMIFLGLSVAWSAILTRFRPNAGQQSRQPASGRTSTAVMALCFALLTSGVVAYINGHSPFADSFYDPPDNVPAAPGQLIRSEPFTRDVPEGAVAWRILYTTTRNDGVPAVASGIVVVPDQAGTEPLPVIAWAHGTTGFDESCAPSVLRHPFESGALPAFDELLERGWALVATDYIGLGTEGPHPYLIGQGEGRSVLDAIRAARQLDAINLSDEAVVWGHSQGGHAALWTGQLAATYAPDAGVIGVAAMAPAADILGLVDWLPGVLGGSVFSSFVAAAYIEHYPDVSWEEHIIPSARTLVREMSGRCLSEPGVLASVLTALSIERDREIFRGNPATGALGARFVENIPTGPIEVPVMIAQGGSDTLVAASVQDGYAAERCRDGWNLVYRVYDEQDHLSVVADSSPLIPDLIAWTMDRFEGKEQLPDCSPAVASVSSIR